MARDGRSATGNVDYIVTISSYTCCREETLPGIPLRLNYILMGKSDKLCDSLSLSSTRRGIYERLLLLQASMDWSWDSSASVDRVVL